MAALLCVATAAQQPGKLTGPGFEIHYPAGERYLASRYYGGWFPAVKHLQRVTGLELPGTVRIELHPSHDDLGRRARALGGREPPEWVAGLAFARSRIVLLRTDLTGPRVERVDQLLRHELLHVACGPLHGEHGGRRFPLWFEEGLAQLVEGRPAIEGSAMLARARILGSLPSLATFAPSFPRDDGGARLAYASGHEFLRFACERARFLTGREQALVLRALVARLARGEALAHAIHRECGTPLDVLEREWRSSLLRRPDSWLRLIGELALATAILLAVLAGVTRQVRRRRAAEARWAEEEALLTIEPEPPAEGPEENPEEEPGNPGPLRPR